MFIGEDEPTTHTTDDMAVEASVTGKRSLSEFKSSSFSFTWRETTTGAYLVNCSLAAFFPLELDCPLDYTASFEQHVVGNHHPYHIWF